MAKHNPGLGELIKRTLAEGLTPIAQGLGEPIGSGIGAAMLGFLERIEKDYAPLLTPIVDALLEVPELPSFMRAVLEEIKAPKSEVAALLGRGFSDGFLGAAGAQIMPAILLPVTYSINRAFPFRILEPSDLIISQLRGTIPKDDFDIFMKAHGFQPFRAEQMIEHARPLLIPDQIRDLRLRGALSVGAARLRLEMLGYKTTDLPLLEELYKVIPGPGDQVRFAVREAFSPEAIESYNLGEAFPEEFATEVAKVGISKDWALRYWYSHWVLPSVGQGYEMLQRGVIDEGTLRDLLRYADLLPWWHDKLIAISYRPYTRVDVRRMYQQGVLDEAQVLRAYRDLGYDAEKAQAMTEFTKRFTFQAQRELTRADILDGYRRGVFERAEAQEMLLDMGYDEDEATFYLDRAEGQGAKELRELTVSNYHSLHTRGILTTKEARDALTELEYSDRAVRLLLELWEQDRGAYISSTTGEKEKDLTRADITDGYRRGLIDPTRARQLLGGLGYDGAEVDFYLAREDRARSSQEKELSTTTYRRLYTLGILTKTATTTALADLGYDLGEVELLLKLWDLERELREKEEAEKIARAAEKKKRDLTLATYRSLYITDIAPEESTRATLVELGYDPEEVDSLITLWDSEREAKVAKPSVATLRRFWQKGIINEGIFRAEVGGQGYVGHYVDWFTEDARP